MLGYDDEGNEVNLSEPAAREPKQGRVTETANTNMAPEARALLDTIAGTESPGYDVRYGGKRFEGYADHPRLGQRIERGPNAGQVSKAAGRYQFITSTWDAQANKLGLKDFSPESQDIAAWDLAESTYGSSLMADLQSGDPNRIARVGRRLGESKQWTSLPGGIEATTNNSRFVSDFKRNLQKYSGGSSTQNNEPMGFGFTDDQVTFPEEPTADEIRQSMPAQDRPIEPPSLIQQGKDMLRGVGDSIEDAGYNLAMTPSSQNPLSPKNLMGAAKAGGYGLAEGAAGLVQAGMEGTHRYLTGPITNAVGLPDPFLDSAQAYGNLRRDLKKAGEDALPKTNNPTLAGVYSGVQSVAQNAFPMVAGLLSGQPEVALIGMSGAVAGQEFGKARDLGKGFELSLLHGGAQSAIEYVTEKLPVGRLFNDIKADTPLWKTITRQIAAEIPGEEAATVLQSIEEKAALHPEKTWSQLADELPGEMYQTAIATIVAAGAQSGMGHAVQKTADRIAESNKIQSLMGDQDFRDILANEVDPKLKGLEKGRAAKVIWAQRQAIKGMTSTKNDQSDDTSISSTGIPGVTDAQNTVVSNQGNDAPAGQSTETQGAAQGSDQEITQADDAAQGPQLTLQIQPLDDGTYAITNGQTILSVYPEMTDAIEAVDQLNAFYSETQTTNDTETPDEPQVPAAPSAESLQPEDSQSGGQQAAQGTQQGPGQEAQPQGHNGLIDAVIQPVPNGYQVVDANTDSVLSEHSTYRDAINAIDALPAGGQVIPGTTEGINADQSAAAPMAAGITPQATQPATQGTDAQFPANGATVAPSVATATGQLPQAGDPAEQGPGISPQTLLTGAPNANDPTTGAGENAPGTAAATDLTQGAERGAGIGAADGRDRSEGGSAGGDGGATAATSATDNPVGEPALVLQNRNRSNPASVQQMQSIAGNPDYLRLSPSRNFADGAPVIAGGQVPAAQMGRKETTVTAKGRRIPVQYAVVEADSVLASNNADGTVNAQYGDTAIQAPRAIAGNGRIAGLQKAYRQGSAGQYRIDLLADDLHGISPDVISGMKAPVLVRVMPESELTQDIGDESNIAGGLSLSPVEQARNDSARLDLEGLDFDEDGTLGRASVLQFVRSMPESEQGGLLDADGTPNRQAHDRLNSAVFHKAYENDELVRLHAQAVDPDAKLVMSALSRLAPKYARLKGKGLFDVRGWLTDAAKAIVNGRRRNLTMQQIADQPDMDIDPQAYDIIRLFADSPRSNKAVIEDLSDFADLAYNEATRDTQDMFGETPRATQNDLRKRLENYRERRGQKDLAKRSRDKSVSQRAEEAAVDAAGPNNAQETAGGEQGLFAGPTAEDRANADREALAEAQREQQRKSNATQAPAADSANDLFAQDNRQDQLKFSLRPDEQQQRIRKLNRGIDAQNRRYAGGSESEARSRVELAAPEDVPASRRIEWKLASAIASVFKHNLILVRGEAGGRLNFDGVVDPNGDPSSIFITVDSVSPISRVVAHELLHGLRLNAPKIYDNLVKSLRQLYDADALVGYVNSRDYGGELTDANEEEWVADFVSNVINSPDGLVRVAFAMNRNKAGSGFNFLRRVQGLVERIKQGLAGTPLGANKVIAKSDLQKAEDAVIEALAQYAAHQEKGTQPSGLLKFSNRTKEKAERIADADYRVLRRNDDNLLPVEQKVFDDFLNSRPDGKDLLKRLQDHRGTPWAQQAIEGIFVRQAIKEYAAGGKPEFQSSFDHPKISKARGLVSRMGEEGIFAYLDEAGLVGDAGKPINNISSSFINCNPSKDCATYCYATKGHYRFAPSVVKSEMVTMAIEIDPARVAQRAAAEYKATAEYANNKALRLFDKGDGNMAWIPFIRQMNSRGVRVHVFSKVPEFLRKVPDMNLKLLSVDNSNMEMADQNPDLPVAFVYSGGINQVDMLAKLAARGQIQVVLPVKLGQKLLDKQQVTMLKKSVDGIGKYLCPIDAGLKEVGPNSDRKKWNCTKCDINGGLGCYHGKVTAAVLNSHEAKPKSGPEIAREILEVRAEIARFTTAAKSGNGGAGGSVAQPGRDDSRGVQSLLQKVDRLMGQLLEQYEPDAETRDALEGNGAAGIQGEGVEAQPGDSGRGDLKFSNRQKADDQAYLNAVNAGDMASAQRMVDAAAVKAGYITSSEYRMAHRAPNSQEDVSLDKVKDSGMVPDDYWTHPQWYQAQPEERESFAKVTDALRTTGQRMWVYRAVPKNAKDGSIRNGDWVTPSRDYARMEGQSISEGYRLIAQRVSLKDLYWDGNSIAELGFDDGKAYAYANTKNNRKLMDVVTRDDDGNIIPLTKRFNKRDDDIRFSNRTIPLVEEPLQDDLFRKQLDLYLDSDLAGQPGPKTEAARREAVAAVESLRRDSGSVLGARLADTYAARQRVSLVGHTLTSREDLATLAQVYRDTRFETFRLFFTNQEGKIVSQVGLTSRLPASSAVIVGTDVKQYMTDLAKAASKVGATHYYMLHNHPSTNPMPSEQDVRMTQLFDRELNLISNGHVVIDTNQFGFIKPSGDVEIIKKDFGQVSPYKTNEFSDTAILNPESLMEVAKRLEVDQDAVTLVVTTAQQKVLGVTTVPADTIRSGSRALRGLRIRKILKSMSGARVFAVGTHRPTLMLMGNLVIDAIHINESGEYVSVNRSMSGAYGQADPFEIRGRQVPRVTADTSAEFDYLRDQTLMARGGGMGTALNVSEPKFSNRRTGQQDAINFYDDVVAGSAHGAKVPDRHFEIGQVTEKTAMEMAQFITGYDGKYRKLRVSSRTIKHIDEQRPKVARMLIANLQSYFESPDEVLPDHKHIGKRALLVHHSSPKSSAAAVEVQIEVVKRDGYLDIVSVMTVPERSLREARTLKSNWREGQRIPVGNSPHPIVAGATHAEADLPVVPPGKKSVDPDVLFSNRRNVLNQPALATWTDPAGSRLDDLIYKMQDKQIDTRRIVNTIKPIDDFDPYLKEALYHGRAAKDVDEFKVNEIKPLLQAMSTRGITIGELETFLWNRHAPEANEQIAKINDAYPDGGSGISTQDALDYLNSLPAGKRTDLEALAAQIDAITAGTRRLLVSSGLETQDTIDAWESAYEHYVPLHRESADVSARGIGSGQGFSTKGPASKRRTGSSKNAADILANLMLQRERAITRAEKNKVGLALYGLAIQNPNPGFWYPVNPDAVRKPAAVAQELIDQGMLDTDIAGLIKEPTVAAVNKQTGLVEHRINPALRNRDNVLAVRINGKDRFLFFSTENERAVRMAESLKNLDAPEMRGLMNAFRMVTRYVSSINTQYNPIFGVKNLIRDVGAGLLNLSTTPIAGKQDEVAKHTGPALVGIWHDLRADRKGNPRSGGQWSQLWEEFQTVGGKTGYRDMYRDSGDRMKALEKELKAIQSGKVSRLTRGLFDWLSDYNETLENSVRLAAYKVGVDSGMTKERAAVMAKELTVNFNRKGQVASQAGSLYAFFNAAVQGTSRLAETLSGPAGKKIVAGGLLLGVIQSLLLAAAGYDDDEPPEFVRERNIIIPMPNGKYITIPMPLGFHVIPNTGRTMMDMALYRGDASKRIAGLLGSYFEAFNPIGSAGWSAQTLAPTFADPIVALSENRDSFGKPIAKVDRSSSQPTPGYTRTKDTASVLSKKLAWGINRLTGGTDYTQGAISPTPDQLDYVFSQATGGVGREVMKLEQAASAWMSGEELPPYKYPLGVGSFVGNTKAQASESNRFYSNITRINELESEIKGRAADGKEIQSVLSDNPEASLVPMANKIERSVTDLRSKKRKLIAQDAPKSAIKAIDTQITAQMKALNDQVKPTRITRLNEQLRSITR